MSHANFNCSNFFCRDVVRDINFDLKILGAEEPVVGAFSSSFLARGRQPLPSTIVHLMASLKPFLSTRTSLGTATVGEEVDMVGIKELGEILDVDVGEINEVGVEVEAIDE